MEVKKILFVTKVKLPPSESKLRYLQFVDLQAMDRSRGWCTNKQSHFPTLTCSPSPHKLDDISFAALVGTRIAGWPDKMATSDVRRIVVGGRDETGYTAQTRMRTVQDS